MLHRLRVLEWSVLRKVLGPEREKVAGGQKRLHNEELHDVYRLPNVIRVVTLGWMRQPEGQRQLSRSRYNWKENIKLDHKAIGWEVVDWINLAQDRYKWWTVVNMIMDFCFLSSTGYFVTSRRTHGLSKRTT